MQKNLHYLLFFKYAAMKHLIFISLLVFFFTLANAGCKVKDKVTAQDLDMTNLVDADDKKKRFFDFMRPIINQENMKILSLRKSLLAAQKNNNRESFVARTAKSYSLDWEIGKEDWDKLLERVDAVALELALAQSANESAWGQSRFAQLGNNFFGQWCYIKGCGIIPEDRKKGAHHEVANFKSVNDSVSSYIKNINTAGVYAPLRKARKKDRIAGKQPDAIAQAGGLTKYSERREAYVKEIREMIRKNKELMRGIKTTDKTIAYH